MKKICVIGNSHSAALKLAFENQLVAEFGRRFSITFFAARSMTLKGLQLNGASLIPTSDELSAAIAQTSGGLNVIDLEEYDAFIIYGLGLDALILTNGFLSEAVLEQTVSDYLEASLSWRLVKDIRKCSSAPIILGHSPLYGRRDDDRKPVAERYIKGMELLNSKLKAQSDTIMLMQPAATVSGINTLGMYMKDDVGHMNERFGYLWLKQALTYLLPA